MTSRNLENLAKIGQLKHEPPSQTEFNGLLASGRLRLKGAANTVNAPESRFDLAYDASHALALAALRWNGFRSENRYLVFQALPRTVGITTIAGRGSRAASGATMGGCRGVDGCMGRTLPRTRRHGSPARRYRLRTSSAHMDPPVRRRQWTRRAPARAPGARRNGTCAWPLVAHARPGKDARAVLRPPQQRGPAAPQRSGRAGPALPGRAGQVRELFPRFDLVVPLAQLEEIGRALAYPKIRRVLGWDDETIGRFLRQLYLRAEVVEPQAEGIEAPRDRDDLRVLAALVAAKADILVTGDGDLLALRDRHLIERPAEFVRRL